MKRHRLGSRGIHSHVAVDHGGLGADARDVLDMDGLDGVAAACRHGEDWHPAQDPGDVVEQNVVLATKYQGWPDNRVRHAGFGKYLLDERLAAEVRQWRVA